MRITSLIILFILCRINAFCQNDSLLTLNAVNIEINSLVANATELSNSFTKSADKQLQKLDKQRQKSVDKLHKLLMRKVSLLEDGLLYSEIILLKCMPTGCSKKIINDSNLENGNPSSIYKNSYIYFR